jgi:5'-3' exonuclease
LGSDLRDLASYNITFDEGRPFTPLLQLLSVLPPQSSTFLPRSYEHLTSPHSPLSLYFPRDFEVDPNGKRNSWESVVQIPFIEENLLVNTVNEIDHHSELTDKEKVRNRFGSETLYDPKRIVPFSG